MPSPLRVAFAGTRWSPGSLMTIWHSPTERTTVNILDTRDLIEELDELIERRDDEDQTDPLDEDDVKRMAEIERVIEEIGDEASYGVVLIPEDDFVEYAQELAEEIGAVDESARWPARHIDWKAAADELRHDYSSVTFDGTDYFYPA